LYLAWTNSTSLAFGDPAAGSNILFIRSLDGGNSFPIDRTLRVTSMSMNLPPTSIRLTNAPLFNATNYDRQVQVCDALGEYQSVFAANGSAHVGWGDTRNQITEPVNALDPISGQTHPQEGVFFQEVKAQ
jgi:hypothetical protein